MQAKSDVQIILLGESEVGKTSLLLRFVDGLFKESLPRTAIDYKKKIIKIKDLTVNLVIWDTAGQEMYYSLVRGYYRSADGVILVYDVQNADTFLKLSKWLVDLKEFNERAEVLIAGNKSEDQNKKSVNISVVKNFAQTEDIEHLEVSAKNGKNVEFLFRHLVKKILAAKGILTFSKSCMLERLARSGDYFSPSSVIPEHSSSPEDQENLNEGKIADIDTQERKEQFKSENDFAHVSNNIEKPTEGDKAVRDFENIKMSEDKPTLTILTSESQEPKDERDSSLANSGCPEEHDEDSDTEFAESALDFFEKFPCGSGISALPPEQTDIIKLTETEAQSDEESCCVI